MFPPSIPVITAAEVAVGAITQMKVPWASSGSNSAIGHQQHQENQVGGQERERRDERIEYAAYDHGDRKHPVFELLQDYVIQIVDHTPGFIIPSGAK